MPMYANTHSLQSRSGRQTNSAREDARAILKRTNGANELDACIFAGNGSTSAINLLVHKLQIKQIAEQVSKQGNKPLTEEQIDKIVQDQDFCEENRFGTYTCRLCKTIVASQEDYMKHTQSKVHQHNLAGFKANYTHYSEKPVVFLSIFEHNANLIPWRESGAHVQLIPMAENGDLDYQVLESKLNAYRSYNSLKICSMTSGSNITGIMTDTDRIAVMCHKAGFLSFFDTAGMCPYTEINMNGLSAHHQETFSVIPKDDIPLAYKDAIFISPHKLVGGPGSSGVLICKQSIMKSWMPDRLGGGIVFFVNEVDHEFVPDKQSREEGGTPGVLQDIRAGLAFQLKEAVTSKTIYEKEHRIHEMVMKRFNSIPNLFVLGNNNLPKITTYSFVVKSKGGKILHPNYVVCILNDLFGIQTRSGCQCSAMYGQKVLGVSLQLTRELKNALMNGNSVLRIGFTRVNFNYFIDDEEVNYILDAIQFVAEYGWMIMPHYSFDRHVGTWKNREEKEKAIRSWIGEVDYSSGQMVYEKASEESHRGKFPFFTKKNIGS